MTRVRDEPVRGHPVLEDSLPDEPVPDPFDDADALEELGEEIATLAAHIHAATHRLLLLIADFDRRRGWELGGHRTCAHWLAYRTGMALGAARERVRTARALVGLPLISASMARGQLSFSKVRALSRVATADTEADLLDCAQGATTAQVERMVRAYRLKTAADEVERDRMRHRDRRLAVYPDVDGMYVVRGRLTPELGALLMRAMEAASDALYRQGYRRANGRPAGDAWDRILEAMGEEEERQAEAGGRGAKVRRGKDSEREAARRRADALGLLAERALGAGFGGGIGGEGEEEEEGDDAGDGDGAEDGSNPAPISGSRAQRYQVVLHVDAATLKAGGTAEGWTEEGKGDGSERDRSEREATHAGRSELDDGTRVSAETSRRLACDAARVVMRHGPDGSILDVGRRRRTIPPALRRALEARDQGCRFPGCGLRFTEAHHVRHWADGGETKLSNTLLLCRHHHRLLHEEGWSMQWWGRGRPAFFDPRGGVHFSGRWQWPEKGESALPREADEDVDLATNLIRSNHERGVNPDGWTASARWKREAHIPDQVYFRAVEALGETAGPDG